MKVRTEKVWRNYLDRIHSVGLNHMARDLGMGSLGSYTKSKKIDLLLIHLDVMGKVKK
tara:strand:+ start:15793 stop:15966 length:174 start_codon:yes stop_codon:yes gene_type:complete